jgi:hypothetical protein
MPRRVDGTLTRDHDESVVWLRHRTLAGGRIGRLAGMGLVENPGAVPTLVAVRDGWHSAQWRAPKG